MSIHFVTNERIAETSSKGNQEKWVEGNRWYKLDQFGYEALAETMISQLLERSNCEEKVKQKMPCFFNKLFCVILCILGSTKRPPAKVPPVAYALSCYFRVIFVCYACVFLLNMNEREQHALRRHPLGQRRVRTAPA